MSYMWIFLLAVCLAIPTEIVAKGKNSGGKTNDDEEGSGGGDVETQGGDVDADDGGKKGGGGGKESGSQCDNCDVNASCNKRGQCQCNPGYHGNGFICARGCVCTSEGDPHTKMFDMTDKRDTLHFQGACMYLMAARYEETRPECNFRVENKHENAPDEYTVAVTKMVKVTLSNGEIIQLGPYENSQDKQVKINGILSEAVHMAGDGSTLELNGGVYYVLTPCGVKVSYDMKHRMSVFVPEDIGGDVFGMCGNCDGSRNDCVGPDGEPYADADGICEAAGYGMSWQTVDPDFPKCDGYVESLPTTCTDENSVLSEQLCSKLDLSNTTNEFRLAFVEQGLSDDMISAVENEAASAFENCQYDVCASLELGRDANYDVCKFIEDFANDVAEELGLSVPCWRDASFCQPTCGENERFYTNFTTPEVSCSGVESTIRGAAQDDCGCACGEGFVRSGSVCVPENECGCFDEENRYYKFGGEFVTDACDSTMVCDDADGDGVPSLRLMSTLPPCGAGATCQVKQDGLYGCVCSEGMVGNGYTCEAGCGEYNDRCHQDATCLTDPDTGTARCVCNNGMDGDGVLHCGEMCRCDVWGDPHYETFDGTKIDFQGPCTYRLTEVTDPTCALTVNIKNFPDDTVSVSKIMYVHVNGDVIKMADRKALFVNGLSVPSGQRDGNGYSVYEDGKFLVLETSCGIKAAWNGKNKGYVEMPTNYGRSAKGMCGRCDGQPYAWETYDGQDVSAEPDRETLVGNSNLVPSEPGFDENCEEYVAQPTPPCPDDVREMGEALCARLNDTVDGPFSECLEDQQNRNYADMIYEGCVFDYCENRNNYEGQDQTICTAFGNVHDMCIEHGNVREWRSDSFCPAEQDLGCDPALNLRYNPAMSVCQPTCMEPKGSKRCRHEVTSGCECTDENLFYENGKCVPKTECGVTTRVKTSEGSRQEYYPLGTSFVTSNCQYRMSVEKKGNRPRFVQRKLRKCDKKTEICGIKDGEYGCVCMEGLVEDGGQCVADGTNPKSGGNKNQKDNSNADSDQPGKEKNQSDDEESSKSKEKSQSGDKGASKSKEKSHSGDEGASKSEEKSQSGDEGASKSKEKKQSGKEGASKSKEKSQSGDEGASKSKEKSQSGEEGASKSEEKSQSGDEGASKSKEKKQSGEEGASKSEEKSQSGDEGASKSNEKSQSGDEGASKSKEKSQSGDEGASKSKEKSQSDKEGASKSKEKSQSDKEGASKSKEKSQSVSQGASNSKEKSHSGDEGASDSKGKSHSGDEGASKSKEISQSGDDGASQSKEKSQSDKEGSSKNKEKSQADDKGSSKRKEKSQSDKEGSSKSNEKNKSDKEGSSQNKPQGGSGSSPDDKHKKPQSGAGSSPGDERNKPQGGAGSSSDDEKNKPQGGAGSSTNDKVNNPPGVAGSSPDDEGNTLPNDAGSSPDDEGYNPPNGASSPDEKGNTLPNDSGSSPDAEGNNSPSDAGSSPDAEGNNSPSDAGSSPDDEGYNPPNGASSPDDKGNTLPNDSGSSPDAEGNNSPSDAGSSPDAEGNNSPSDAGSSPDDEGYNPPNGASSPDDKGNTLPNDSGSSPDAEGNNSPSDAGSSPDAEGNNSPSDAGSSPDDEGYNPPNGASSPDDKGNTLPNDSGSSPDAEGNNSPSDAGSSPDAEGNNSPSVAGSSPDDEGYNPPNAGSPSDNSNSPQNDNGEEIPEPCVEETEEVFDFPVVTPSGPKVVNCLRRDDPNGYNYGGDISRTIGGIVCQKWSTSQPHSHNYLNVFSQKDKNFCRNRPWEGVKGLEDKPWCYTTDPTVVWQYCDIAMCETDEQEDGIEDSPPAATPLPEEEKKCYKLSDRGVSYDGKVNFISDGEVCDFWKDNGYLNVEHNYCRNMLPDKHSMPFCFVEGRKRDCVDIDICGEEEDEEEKENPPKCSVETMVTLCGTVTTLTGSCEQTFDHPDECRFKVVHINGQKYRVDFSRENYEVILEIGLKEKHDSVKCGSFEITDPDKLKITTPTCGMCMKSSFNTIMPDPESYSLSPKKLFCRAP